MENMHQPPSWYTTTQYLKFKIDKLSQAAEALITQIPTGSINWPADRQQVLALLEEMTQLDLLYLGLQNTLQEEAAWEQSPEYQTRWPWPRTDELLQIRTRETLAQEANHLESQKRQIEAWVTRQESLEEQRRRQMDHIGPFQLGPPALRQVQREPQHHRLMPDNPQPTRPVAQLQPARRAVQPRPARPAAQPQPHPRQRLPRLAPKPVVQPQPPQGHQQVQPHLPQGHQQVRQQQHRQQQSAALVRPAPLMALQRQAHPQQPHPQQPQSEQGQHRRVSPLTQFLIDCGAIPADSPLIKPENSPEIKKESPSPVKPQPRD
ncbi:uncharacterized protein QC763_511113 [Podospora pseudopauciseta]|uniref:Uncharacterized protein n=1 Tax=Podospora pseudopauciseta TaxID=2093780 RepID=A0ABR0HB88_9PEZI|nr:hypothetical protein QC763_511113 [Podospora pseudopauciseta]